MATNNNVGYPTMQEFIEGYLVEPITIDNFFLKEVFTKTNGEKVVIQGANIITNYMDELQDSMHTVTLSDIEYMKYRFRPKQMSYDIYGTTELWWLILMINEIPSATQFDLKTVRLFDTTIKNKLERIITLNEEIIKENNDAVRDTLQDK